MKKEKIMKRKIRGKNKRNFFLWSKVFLGMVCILGVLLISLIVVQFIDVNSLFEKDSVEKIKIVDECSPLEQYGLIHQIRDEADCSNNCVSACMTRDMEKVDVEFTKSNSSCHKCVCYCK